MGNEIEPEPERLPENFSANPDRQPIHKAAHTSNSTLAVFLKTIAVDYPDDAKDLLMRRDGRGALPLHHAVAGGQTEALKALLALYNQYDLLQEEGPANATMGDVSLLEVAITKGHFEVAFVLLGAGAKVKASHGVSSPLHWLAEVGGKYLHLGARLLVDELVSRGADINQLDEEGRTPLQVALEMEDLGDVVQKQQEELVLHLMALPGTILDPHALIPGTDQSLFQTACSGGMPRVLEKLLAIDPSVLSARVENNQTCLHLAVQSNSLESVKVILRANPEINTKTDDGITPLHVAVRNGEFQIAQELLNAGADPNIHSPRGPLIFDVLAQGDECLDFLSTFLSKGADPNVEHDKKRPLHKAVLELLDPAIIRLLVEHGADVNAKDGQGFTPLYIAAGKGDGEALVEVLLSLGALQTVLTPGGATPLHAAAHKGLVGTMEKLIKNGGNVNARTTSGKTPLMLAVAQKKEDAATLLLLKGATD